MNGGQKLEHFIRFSTDTTNIFPAANSTTGSQLLTEYNLKSRESVATDPAIKYAIGHSFTHSEDDFKVSLGTSSAKLLISAGRAVINGYYVESLTDIEVDLVEANIDAVANQRPMLKGQLGVGLKTYLATEETIAGSIYVEGEVTGPNGNTSEMFLGIQVVVGPLSEFVTPSDSPEAEGLVTCDLKLAEIVFTNNAITSILNSTAKTQYMPASRVAGLTDAVSSQYISKLGLDSKKIYSFAGKGVDPETGKDTWEDVTDSTVVWDKGYVNRKTSDPEVVALYKQAFPQADIHYNTELTDYNAATGSSDFEIKNVEGLSIVVPHKEVEGMEDISGNREIYKPRSIEIPSADYLLNTPGIITKAYTKNIKEISSKVNDLRSIPNGKQVMFIDTKAPDDPLPPVNQAWKAGDYIIVKNDESYYTDLSDVSSPPATMYIVLPGLVQTIEYQGGQSSPRLNIKIGNKGELLSNDEDAAYTPVNITGTQLGFQEWHQTDGKSVPATVNPISSTYAATIFSMDDGIRGDHYSYDYFRVRYYPEYGYDADGAIITDPQTETAYIYGDYFYRVSTSGPEEWSDPILLTGSIDLATEEIIGGFLNVSEDATNSGYVYLDDSGHLRMLDYERLASGALAYQLGTAVTISGIADIETIQAQLDEYVNNRVAFPVQYTLSASTSVVDIYLTLPDAEGVITIKGIDSRFNTAVRLHVLGAATSGTIIQIVDCEKFIIDPNIEGNPIIDVYRTCLYYDPSVMQYIRTCSRTYPSVTTPFSGFSGVTLWYTRFTEDDPDLLILEGMTVTELDGNVISSDINYWSEIGSQANDNHYAVAVKSLTFSGSGDVVQIQILVQDNSTDNVDPGDKVIVGDIQLPQNSSLPYPAACITKPLKVSGEFTSAYLSNPNSTWYISDNSFSLLTEAYVEGTDYIGGTIAFHSTTTLLPSTVAQGSIPAWERGSWHIFQGGTIS